MKKKVSRRAAVQLGIGAAVGLTTGRLTSGTDCTTPAQASGPFYPNYDQLDKDIDLTRVDGVEGSAEGEVIRVKGQVIGDDLKPVEGALVEIWQANKWGRYRHEDDPNPAPLDPAFQGWGQVKTDANGSFAFTTVRPGAYPASETWVRPPHIHFKVARRGYHELITQMYFEGESLNENDALLQDVPPDERERLVVRFADDPDGVPSGRFIIMLRRVMAG